VEKRPTRARRGLDWCIECVQRITNGRARWRHQANTVGPLRAAAVSESAISGGDTACFQIALDNLVDPGNGRATLVQMLASAFASQP